MTTETLNAIANLVQNLVQAIDDQDDNRSKALAITLVSGFVTDVHLSRLALQEIAENTKKPLLHGFN